MNQSRITPTAPQVLVPHFGKGKELCDMLKQMLDIPPDARAFSVHFEAGEPIRVVVERHARG